ncbi:hypothetical protein G7K_4338-t1 [Saitoella complicata NRRL Y-17804]|uniref:Gated mechanosensitive channel n=2 Tax=Saitoella complicata (strain BCRC 22490 / CBS 7301 / JCM 7358 / NBRC 10748 / NRRL Y-17804) TaxID=698492 RepID=A0A0E9NK34_SAICN|nr:hypothetical protein G7K_4338-t1 [Saitoella complicata NRRL Y-17804]
MMSCNYGTIRHGVQDIEHGAQAVWNDFKDFINRDNIFEVAVGLMIGNAFTSVVTSLVSDVLLPPIALLPGISSENLPAKFLVLRHGETHQASYNTLEQAAADGAVTLAYGSFFQKALDFMGMGFFLYVIVQLIFFLDHKDLRKRTKKCHYCRKKNNMKAVRCMYCTCWMDGREDYSKHRNDRGHHAQENQENHEQEQHGQGHHGWGPHH